MLLYEDIVENLVTIDISCLVWSSWMRLDVAKAIKDGAEKSHHCMLDKCGTCIGTDHLFSLDNVMDINVVHILGFDYIFDSKVTCLDLLMVDIIHDAITIIWHFYKYVFVHVDHGNPINGHTSSHLDTVIHMHLLEKVVPFDMHFVLVCFSLLFSTFCSRIHTCSHICHPRLGMLDMIVQMKIVRNMGDIYYHFGNKFE
jgi:hypothetical protein